MPHNQGIYIDILCTSLWNAISRNEYGGEIERTNVLINLRKIRIFLYLISKKNFWIFELIKINQIILI